MAISEKRVFEHHIDALEITVKIQNKKINGLIELNDNLTKENAELKRQIEVFTKAEIWGDDANG